MFKQITWIVLFTLLSNIFITGCATTTPFDKKAHPIPSADEKLTNIFSYNVDYFVFFEYDATKQEVARINEIKLMSPGDKLLTDMYTQNLNQYKESHKFINECVALKKNGTYSTCLNELDALENTNHKSDYLSLYYDTTYLFNYTIGLILLAPIIGMMGPNFVHRDTDIKRVNFVGGMVDKKIVSSLKNNEQPVVDQMGVIAETIKKTNNNSMASTIEAWTWIAKGLGKTIDAIKSSGGGTSSGNSPTTTSPGTSYLSCNSGDICFETVKEYKGSYGNLEYQIRCTKGSNGGKEGEVCINPRGKWANKCGPFSLSYNYDSMKEASNYYCK